MSNQSSLNKRINFEFTPRKLLEVQDFSVIEKINDYPVSMCPTLNGVDILIRSGKPHMVEAPCVIYNYSFKQEFLELLRITFKRRMTVHCTLVSEIASNEELVAILQSKDTCTFLPVDCVLQLNDCFFEYIADRVPLYARIAQLDYLIYKEVKDDKRIKFPKITKASTIKDIEDVVSMWAASLPKFKSVILQNFKSFYKDYDLLDNDCDVIEYKPIREYKGIIRNINCQVIEDGDKLIPFAINMEVAFKSKYLKGIVYLTVDLGIMTIEQRKALAKIRQTVKGTFIIFEGVNDPKSIIPIHRKFLKFGL